METIIFAHSYLESKRQLYFATKPSIYTDDFEFVHPDRLDNRILLKYLQSIIFILIDKNQDNDELKALCTLYNKLMSTPYVDMSDLSDDTEETKQSTVDYGRFFYSPNSTPYRATVRENSYSPSSP